MDSDALLESFNLGVVGMILVVPSAYVKKVEADFEAPAGEILQIAALNVATRQRRALLYSGALNL